MSEIESQEKIIEVKDISFSYGSNEVLKNISFVVPRGDYIGVVGPNGAGKTTLLKIILGLLTPSKGTVELFSKDIHQFKDWPKIGYVPQKATSFDENFPATVEEVVLMGRSGRRGLFHGTNALDKKIVKSSLEKVGMWEYKDRLVGDLSGGQQQRVFIARALATEPEIIFLDEPTVGIDPNTRTEFYALLKSLNNEHNLTLILISHDIETITREVKHMICINRVFVCYSVPDEFLRNSKLSETMGGIQIIGHQHNH